MLLRNNKEIDSKANMASQNTDFRIDSLEDIRAEPATRIRK